MSIEKRRMLDEGQMKDERVDSCVPLLRSVSDKCDDDCDDTGGLRWRWKSSRGLCEDVLATMTSETTTAQIKTVKEEVDQVITRQTKHDQSNAYPEVVFRSDRPVCHRALHLAAQGEVLSWEECEGVCIALHQRRH